MVIDVFKMSGACPDRTTVIWWFAVKDKTIFGLEGLSRGRWGQVGGEMGGCSGGGGPFPPLTGLSSTEVTDGLQSVWDSG